MFPFCLSSNFVKSFSLKYIFDIGAALEGKTIFFNTFHRSLAFLAFFWSWFLTKFVLVFFIFCFTELRFPLKRSWSTWSFVHKNPLFNLSLTLMASMASLSNHGFEFPFTRISFIGAISLTICCAAVVKSMQLHHQYNWKWNSLEDLFFLISLGVTIWNTSYKIL